MWFVIGEAVSVTTEVVVLLVPMLVLSAAMVEVDSVVP